MKKLDRRKSDVTEEDVDMTKQILLKIIFGFIMWAILAIAALYVGWSEIFASMHTGFFTPFPNEKIVLSLICALVSIIFVKVVADRIAELRISMNW